LPPVISSGIPSREESLLGFPTPDGDIISRILLKESHMADLSTNYMGISLKNPIIVGSSDLTKHGDKIKEFQDQGAGAVVLKSIFEEQFLMEAGDEESLSGLYPEALDYLRSGGLMEYAPRDMVNLIEKVKKETDIPIIASINCQTQKLWPRFAKQVEDAGADAIELNIYDLVVQPEVSGILQEDNHLNILNAVKNSVKIPVSVKLSTEFTSMPHITSRLAEAGAGALVFFNWFLEPDIDINTRKTRNMKGKANFNQSLRWVALLSGRVSCDISASGGIGDWQGIIKQLLAGASAVQICSLFFRKGAGIIPELLAGISSWMENNKYNTLEDFRGDLSFRKQELSFNTLGESEAYFRSQYLKTYS
jgi:dihydroorotate dehydrogenase (fumarate)